jgi:hypothetical protein
MEFCGGCARVTYQVGNPSATISFWYVPPIHRFVREERAFRYRMCKRSLSSLEIRTGDVLELNDWSFGMGARFANGISRALPNGVSDGSQDLRYDSIFMALRRCTHRFLFASRDYLAC